MPHQAMVAWKMHTSFLQLPWEALSLSPSHGWVQGQPGDLKVPPSPSANPALLQGRTSEVLEWGQEDTPGCQVGSRQRLRKGWVACRGGGASDHIFLEETLSWLALQKKTCVF